MTKAKIRMTKTLAVRHLCFELFSSFGFRHSSLLAKRLSRIIQPERIQRIPAPQMRQISPQYYARQRAGSIENDLGAARGLPSLEITHHLRPISAPAAI